MIGIEFEPVVNGCERDCYSTKIAVLVVAIRDLLSRLIVRAAIAIAIVTGHLLVMELAYQKGTVDGLFIRDYRTVLINLRLQNLP